MRKPKHYHNRTYRTDYLYFVGWTEKQFKNYCEKNFKMTLDVSTDAGITIEFKLNSGELFILIWTLNAKDYGSLSHECLHAANFTLARVGVKPSFINDEGQAYLAQDIFDFAIGS